MLKFYNEEKYSLNLSDTSVDPAAALTFRPVLGTCEQSGSSIAPLDICVLFVLKQGAGLPFDVVEFKDLLEVVHPCFVELQL